MFLSETYFFFRTVKFRIALFYTLLFGVSMLIAFVSAYLFLNAVLNQKTEQTLRNLKDEFLYEYLTGTEIDGSVVLIPEKEIPRGILTEILSRSPSFRLSIAVSREENTVSMIGTESGRMVEYSSSDGTPAMLRRREFSHDPVKVLRREFDDRFYGEKTANLYLILLLSPGEKKLLARSAFRKKYIPALMKQDFSAMKRRSNFATVASGGSTIRVLNHRLYDGNMLIVGFRLDEDERNMSSLLAIFGVSLLAMTFIGFLCGCLIAREFTRGITRVANSARVIGKGDFSERVKHGGEGAEIDELVHAFNGMAENTEKLLTELRTITDNIAHDLRTPVTRMRGMAELSIGSGQGGELASDIAEECGKLLHMINTMLEITQTEYRLEKREKSPFELVALAKSITELFSTVAEDKGVLFKVELPDGPLQLFDDKVKFQRLFGNLLDNAIKFTQEKGTVVFRLQRQDGVLKLTVSDTGCGIDKKDLPHIFDRFFRSDASRSLPGNGLGLSLVHAIVESMDGSIDVDSRPGTGTSFVVRIPDAPAGKRKAEETERKKEGPEKR